MKIPKFLAIGGSILVVVGALLVLGFCAGTRHAANSVSSKQIVVLQAKRDTMTDTIRVVEARIPVESKHVAAARDTARAAVATFDTAAHALTAAADTSTTGRVPIGLALPPLELCHTALVAKDSVIDAQATLIIDLTKDRDAWKTYALAGDSLAKLEPRPPRFGLKTGFVLGAGAALAVLRPELAARAVKWLITHAL